MDTQIERLYKKLCIHSRIGLAVRVFTEVLRVREEGNRRYNIVDLGSPG